MTDTSEAFFERKYQQTSDPWNFASSPYENLRYRTILRALPARRFRRTFEPGCSIGVLTQSLAQVSDSVEASDISASAIASARNRCQGLANINFSTFCLSSATPLTEPFDLVVFSELGYYFAESELFALAHHVISSIVPGGIFLASHWLGVSTEHTLKGDRVHEILHTVPGLLHEFTEQNDSFLLERWRKE